MRRGHSGTALLLLGLSAFLLFYRLGSYGLVETADARYAEIAWEMYQSGDWLTPKLNYVKHFHKPPLTFWTIAAGYHLLGENEWGARLGLGLTGLATLLLTYGLARRLYGERVGLLAWAILLSMGGFLGAHRLLTTDPLLTLWMTAALYAFWRWQEAGEGRFSHLFFACLGLAMLTKGPVGVAVVWLIIAAWAFAAGRLRELGRLRWGAGLGLFAALGLGWYLYAVLQNEGLLRYFLFGQLAERVSGEMGHPRPFWYIGAMFLLYCLPWTPYLAPALGWRPLPSRGGAEKAFLAAWALVPVVFFSLPATKLPNYILPALPPVAIVLAAWWQETARLGAGGRLAAALLGAALLVYPALLLVRPGITPGLEGLAPVVAALGILAAGLQLVSALTARPRLALVGAACLLPLLLVVAGFETERLPLRSWRPLGVRVAELAGPSECVATYRCYLYSLPFYAQRRVTVAGMSRTTQFETEDPRPYLPSPEEFLAGWESRGRTYCILPEWTLPDFEGKPFQVLGRHRRLVLISNEAKGG